MAHSKYFLPVLLFMVTATLAACSSSHNKTAEGNTARTSVEQPAAVPVAEDTAPDQLMVSGSRIGQSTRTPEVGDMAEGAAQASEPQIVHAQASGVRPPPYTRQSQSQPVSLLHRLEAGFPVYPQGNTERYATLTDNGITQTSSQPVSTFSIDVDTGAYSNVRRFLNHGQLPPRDAVRTEELLNYFSYDYPAIQTRQPFSISTEVAPSPWHAGRHLLHIGIRALEPAATEHLQRNLVFLVDVSGSMQGPDKLELLKTSLKLLSRQLNARDSIAIVVYAGASGVVLEPTAGNESAAILAALDRLQPGGSTNGAAGIQLAYSLAQQHFKAGGINRVLLATDGDFNVGLTDFAALQQLIEQKRKSGISLSTLGFGTGNYNDQLMEQLADAGNGNYAYIDSINEARKVLVDELESTLQTVARDVKIQIEFNPSVVSEYRLVGYENRMLAQEDFNNDKVDAGEIGAGHTVTALYEISLVGSSGQSVDPLRYSNNSKDGSAGNADELAWLKLRYKEPEADSSQILEQPVWVSDIVPALDDTSNSYRFAAAVAGFAQLLRDNQALGVFDYADVLALAMGAKGTDTYGYRSEFINLVKTAQVLSLDL